MSRNDFPANGGRQDVTVNHDVISTAPDHKAAGTQVAFDRDWIGRSECEAGLKLVNKCISSICNAYVNTAIRTRLALDSRPTGTIRRAFELSTKKDEH